MERQNLQCQQAQNYHLNDVSKQSNDFALDVVFNVVFEFIVPEVWRPVWGPNTSRPTTWIRISEVWRPVRGPNTSRPTTWIGISLSKTAGTFDFNGWLSSSNTFSTNSQSDGTSFNLSSGDDKYSRIWTSSSSSTLRGLCFWLRVLVRCFGLFCWLVRPPTQWSYTPPVGAWGGGAANCPSMAASCCYLVFHW